VVGSPSLGGFVPELEVAAEDIDGGVIGRWWIVAGKKVEALTFQRAVVVYKNASGSDITQLLAQLLAVGIVLESAYCEPSGSADFRYNYLLLLDARDGEVAQLAEIVQQYGARLAGVVGDVIKCL
jgi:hypothetical protein